jgi:hypothetical protein
MMINKVNLDASCKECGEEVLVEEEDGVYVVNPHYHECFDSPFPRGSKNTSRVPVVTETAEGAPVLNREQFDFEISPIASEDGVVVSAVDPEEEV